MNFWGEVRALGFGVIGKPARREEKEMRGGDSAVKNVVASFHLVNFMI